MKKIFGKSGILALVFVIVMMLALTACKKAEEPVEFNEKKYLKKAAENAIDELNDLASGNYVEMMSASDEVNSVVKKWGKTEIDKSEQIIVISIGDKQAQKLLDALSEDNDEFDDFSDEDKKYIVNRMLSSLPNIINSRYGVNILAAASTVGYSRTYVPAEAIENQIWFIKSDGDVDYVITFTNTGDGAITLNAQYVYNKDGMLGDMSDALSEFFGGHDIFEVKEIKW